MTLTFRVCFYTPSFSAVYRVFSFNLLCCTPPVMLVHPDRLRLLTLMYRAWHALYWSNLLSSFFSEASLPYPILSFSFWILPLPKFTLPWSVFPSWPVSNLSYSTVWLEPTLYFPVCTTVTESKLSLLATQQATKSKRPGVKARNPILFGEPTDQEDGRLMSLNNHLVEARFLYGSEMGGCEETK